MDEISTLYYQKPKTNIMIYLIFIVLISLLIYISFKYHTYDIKELAVLNECNEEKCILKTTLSLEEQDILNNNPIIIYDQKEYKINEIEYNETYLSNNIPVTDISIDSELKEKKQILKIKIKYNKQRIIKSIKEKIIERN